MIYPHPNFRIFLTSESSPDADARMSKALRNRCLEIHIGSHQSLRIPCMVQLPHHQLPADHQTSQSEYPINYFESSVRLMVRTLHHIERSSLSLFESVSFESLSLTLQSIEARHLSGLSSTMQNFIDSFRLISSLNNSSNEFSLFLSSVRLIIELYFWSISNFCHPSILKSFKETFPPIGENDPTPALLHSTQTLMELLRSSGEKTEANGTSVLSLKELLSKCSTAIKKRMTNILSSPHLLMQWASAGVVGNSIITIKDSIVKKDRVKRDSEIKMDFWPIFESSFCSVLLGGEEPVVQFVIKSGLRRLFTALQLQQNSPIWEHLRSTMCQICCPNNLTLNSIRSISNSAEIAMAETILLRSVLLQANQRLNSENEDASSLCALRRACWRELGLSIRFIMEKRRGPWNETIRMIQNVISESRVNDIGLGQKLNGCIVGLQRCEKLFQLIERQLSDNLKVVQSEPILSMSVLVQTEAVLVSLPTLPNISENQIERIVNLKSSLIGLLDLSINYPHIFGTVGMFGTPPSIPPNSAKLDRLHSFTSLSIWDCQLLKARMSESSLPKAFGLGTASLILPPALPQIASPKSLAQNFHQNYENSDLLDLKIGHLQKCLDIQNRHCLLCNRAKAKSEKRSVDNPDEILSILIESQWSEIQQNVSLFTSRLAMKNKLEKIRQPTPDLLTLRPAYSYEVEVLLEISISAIYRFGLRSDDVGLVVERWFNCDRLLDVVDATATLRCLNAIRWVLK